MQKKTIFESFSFLFRQNNQILNAKSKYNSKPITAFFSAKILLIEKNTRLLGNLLKIMQFAGNNK
jgi:hypothetical protein